MINTRRYFRGSCEGFSPAPRTRHRRLGLRLLSDTAAAAVRVQARFVLVVNFEYFLGRMWFEGRVQLPVRVHASWPGACIACARPIVRWQLRTAFEAESYDEHATNQQKSLEHQDAWSVADRDQVPLQAEKTGIQSQQNRMSYNLFQVQTDPNTHDGKDAGVRDTSRPSRLMHLESLK